MASPELRPGDSVRVHAKVVEGNRERIQVFEGVVIRLRKGGVGAQFWAAYVPSHPLDGRCPTAWVLEQIESALAGQAVSESVE